MYLLISATNALKSGGQINWAVVGFVGYFTFKALKEPDNLNTVYVILLLDISVVYIC